MLSLKDFEAIIPDKAASLSNLTRPRMRLLAYLAKRVASCPGDVIEVGVFKGGSALLLQSLFPERELWLCDTFQGNPPPGQWDREGKGSYSCSLDKVKDVVHGERVHYVEGVFPESFEFADGQQFCLAHLDCDQYESVKRSAEALLPRITGVIVCDDYCYLPGARKAFDEVMGDQVRVENMSAYAFCGDGNGDLL